MGKHCGSCRTRTHPARICACDRIGAGMGGQGLSVTNGITSCTRTIPNLVRVFARLDSRLPLVLGFQLLLCVQFGSLVRLVGCLSACLVKLRESPCNRLRHSSRGPSIWDGRSLGL